MPGYQPITLVGAGSLIDSKASNVGTYSLSSGLGTTVYNALDPDDVVFFASRDQANNVGSLVGTNATSITIQNPGWYGIGLAWVRAGSASGNYGFSTADDGMMLFWAMRGLDPTAPVQAHGTVDATTGAINNSSLTFTVPGQLMFVYFRGDGQTGGMPMTSTSPAMTVSSVRSGRNLGLAYSTDQRSAGATGTVRSYPDAAGGSGRESWMTMLALKALPEPDLWTDLGSRSPMVMG